VGSNAESACWRRHFRHDPASAAENLIGRSEFNLCRSFDHHPRTAVKNKLLDALKETLPRFFGTKPEESYNYGKMINEKAIPALYKGGSNADVCYGTSASSGDINNIMGFGSSFDKDNAKPWLDRMFLHLNLGQFEFTRVLMGASKWRVTLTPAPPMTMVTPNS